MSNDFVINDGLEHVRYLADTIGKRPTGSEGDKYKIYDTELYTQLKPRKCYRNLFSVT